MIKVLSERFSKAIAFALLLVFYSEVVFANLNNWNNPHDYRNIGAESTPPCFIAIKRATKVSMKGFDVKSNPASKQTYSPSRLNSVSKTLIGGPSQPEMQAFQPVNGSNMVDLFSGDFSYNIPLLDVGGYPVNIAYKSGITMDQEASWVGLGWNINPGTITRNLRGIPDDFNGSDSIRKTTSIKTNTTIGVNVGADIELTGVPLSLGASIGVFHNNYKGWGTEIGLNASLNSGQKASGPMSGGLSLTDNSQEGVTVSPTLSCKINGEEAKDNAGVAGSTSISLPYNSRTGLKGLQLSTGITKYGADKKNQQSSSSSYSSFISFATPSYTPTISIPYTSSQFSFTAKVGFEGMSLRPDVYLSGYISAQGIANQDKTSILPAYGYMNYEQGDKSGFGLLDFNREKEIPYREKPAVAHIAMPVYTYDIFSITGEGTGGMFRAYRGDIGFVNDHYMKTKDHSIRGSIDLGFGDLFHAGVDLNLNRAYTQSGPWLNENALANTIGFRKANKDFEAAYFRNPSEKSENSKSFYAALGGDNVVSVNLFQPNSSSPSIIATNSLTEFKNKSAVGTDILTAQNTVRDKRDKRTQLISYLTAGEASTVGLSRYIESYAPDSFSLSGNCYSNIVDDNFSGEGTGFNQQYFAGTDLKVLKSTSLVTGINHPTNFTGENTSYRWFGKLKAPATGMYIFKTISDDGVKLWLNDTLIIHNWTNHAYTENVDTVNLIAGAYYDFRLEYYNGPGYSRAMLKWQLPGSTVWDTVPHTVIYPDKAWQNMPIGGGLNIEKRVNGFRKSNHISEIDVLNKDGRKYVYGIPVYNLWQKESSFSVDKERANRKEGTVAYSSTDNSVNNIQGKDNYYNSEEVPAYAHGFLLTGILSNDYVDVTGNGISDDDQGDAIKFNYSKIYGLGNPFKWRAPYMDSATYNEGMKTDNRDDRGNYVYGEKELWYLHSIESKTMYATFVLDNSSRLDGMSIDEGGHKLSGSPSRRLREINLYTKSDYLKKGGAAKPIKTVHFEYSYELCKGANKPINDSGKLTLKKIWFSYNGNDKGRVSPYVFNYHPNNPGYNIKSYDKWGNYKDPLQNPNSTQTNFITNAEYPYSLKDSAKGAYNAAAWTLNDIRLPSGGRIKVDYESDDYAYVQNKRAMEMFQITSLGSDTIFSHSVPKFYDGTDGDRLFVFIKCSTVVKSRLDVFNKYLKGMSKLFFKVSVRVPADMYGSGNESVPGYADIDFADNHAYGRINDSIIWVKVKGISLKGDGDGGYSPLAKAAIQFLRLNLPSKAYPNSEVGDNFDPAASVKAVFAFVPDVLSMFDSYDRTARENGFCKYFDPTRSYVRLCSPDYKKIGGGLRVKRIVVYDNWKIMTGGRESSYGQEYDYTTIKEIDGVMRRISSGVSTFEPMVGSDENPFRVPIEYVEKIAPLGPVTLGYTEEPLGESFFPSASVGYSKVSVRSIHTKNRRSANGHEETEFYTSYDFPTLTDRSLLDGSTKKRFKPALANFLRINARNYLSLSQGFKVELNDMNGKVRSQGTFSETDTANPISYTAYYYKVDDPLAESKHLTNTAYAMEASGSIDTAALIGKDMELMVDMREQISVSNGLNLNLNTDFFFAGIWPVLIPAAIGLAQREETKFRSVATNKIIQRYGILDSVIHIEKGSRVSTQNMLYDSETGDVLLTRTQNEFNDPVYQFNYPAYRAYDGMAAAYRNIGVVLSGIYMKDGRITKGLPAGTTEQTFFTSGDEIWLASHPKTSNSLPGDTCAVAFATFPSYSKVWAVDTSMVNGGISSMYFVDENGTPFTGNNIDLKIIRSGRRNVSASVGSVTSLNCPLVQTTSGLQIQFNSNTRVIAAQSQEYKQLWRVEDQMRAKKVCSGQ